MKRVVQAEDISTAADLLKLLLDLQTQSYDLNTMNVELKSTGYAATIYVTEEILSDRSLVFDLIIKGA